ncbi:hypothetical protein WJX75_005737 [Coccomyxa subellipsoidea]|uniref:Uncharacterized protein n=1 Tax=Coccomyxa subellipsoidea TaxID=248742 RepID=A0ABR2Z395_9CHLO
MNTMLLGFTVFASIYAGESAALSRRHLNGAEELAPAPSAEVALPAILASADALLTITNPQDSGAVSLPIAAGSTVRVSLERPAAPAPGLPADLSSGLSAQPRYDVSSSFSYTGPIDSFGYSYTGSSSGVSYSDNIANPIFSGSESVGVTYSSG